jgi:hypothetical protein
MAYKPQPNQRRHRRLIGDALAEAELAQQELDQLQRVAKNDATKNHVRGIQIRTLKIANLLHQMMEIARLEQEDNDE